MAAPLPASLGMEVGNVSSHNGHTAQTCCLSFHTDEGRREQNCNTLIVSFITYSLCLTTACRCWPHVPRVPLIPEYNVELSSLSFNGHTSPSFTFNHCKQPMATQQYWLNNGATKGLKLHYTPAQQHLLACCSSPQTHGSRPVKSWDGCCVPGDRMMWEPDAVG